MLCFIQFGFGSKMRLYKFEDKFTIRQDKLFYRMFVHIFLTPGVIN